MKDRIKQQLGVDRFMEEWDDPRSWSLFTLIVSIVCLTVVWPMTLVFFFNELSFALRAAR